MLNSQWQVCKYGPHLDLFRDKHEWKCWGDTLWDLLTWSENERFWYNEDSFLRLDTYNPHAYGQMAGKHLVQHFNLDAMATIYKCMLHQIYAIGLFHFPWSSTYNWLGHMSILRHTKSFEFDKNILDNFFYVLMLCNFLFQFIFSQWHWPKNAHSPSSPLWNSIISTWTALIKMAKNIPCILHTENSFLRQWLIMAFHDWSCCFMIDHFIRWSWLVNWACHFVWLSFRSIKKLTSTKWLSRLDQPWSSLI